MLYVPIIVMVFLFFTFVGDFVAVSKPKTKNFKVTMDLETNYVYLDPLEGEPQQTIIFYHGLLQSSKSHFSKFAELGMVPLDSRVILAQAEPASVTVFDNSKWRSWFDIYTWSG